MPPAQFYFTFDVCGGRSMRYLRETYLMCSSFESLAVFFIFLPSRSFMCETTALYMLVPRSKHSSNRVTAYHCTIWLLSLQQLIIIAIHERCRTFMSGHPHRLGSADSPDRRIHATASDDGYLWHPDADAARGRARSDLVVHAAGEGLPKARCEQEARSPRATSAPHRFSGHEQGKPPL